jgi:hypothetical protein
MAKYAIGDVVAKDNKSSGVVRAIFTTVEGQLRYAVEIESALGTTTDPWRQCLARGFAERPAIPDWAVHVA